MQSIERKMIYQMKDIQWTGNPLVDTGLAVIIARAKEIGIDVKTISDLTPEIIGMVCKSKFTNSSPAYSWITRINRKLNSYTMTFSNNNPLTNPSANPEKNLKGTEGKIKASLEEIEKIEKKIAEIEQNRQTETEKLSVVAKEKDKNKTQKEIEKLKKSLANQQDKLFKKKAALKKLEEKKKSQESKLQNGAQDKGLQDYIEIIKSLHEDLKDNSGSNELSCEGTGKYKASKVLRNHQKELGREWFPLAGTMKDIQTLPAASRPLQLSSLSLLATQFLPMGAAMLSGKLVCFQTNDFAVNDVPMFQSIIEEIYTETMTKAALKDNVETFGKDGGYNSIAFLFLHRLQDFYERKSLDKVPDYLCLNLWRFSNSGQDPYLEIIEIPNEALQFLWETWRGRLRDEIEKYLKAEKNFPKEYTLLECIKEKRLYEPFFKPYKIKNSFSSLASVGLFDLYTTKILGYKPESLATAKWIAYQIKKLKSDKDLTELKDNISKYHKQIKGILAELADEANLSLEDYLFLFSCLIHPLRVDKDKQSISNKIIWFYLHHNLSISEKPMNQGDVSMFVHPKYPKIKSFAHDFFNYFIGQQGQERFERRILKAFRQEQIRPRDIEHWFATLAEFIEGYTNEEWDDLCRDEYGKSDVWEVIFQLRLELVNLYRNKYKTSN